MAARHQRKYQRAAAGTELIHQAIQFHGDADLFVAENATVFATLYKDDKTASAFPAVSSIQAGSGAEAAGDPARVLARAQAQGLALSR